MSFWEICETPFLYLESEFYRFHSNRSVGFIRCVACSPCNRGHFKISRSSQTLLVIQEVLWTGRWMMECIRKILVSPTPYITVLSLGNSIPIADRTGGLDLAVRVSGERHDEDTTRNQEILTKLREHAVGSTIS